MFCQYCGYNLRARARFCNKCGKPIKERFGSALLQQPPPSGTTDEISLRGTGRQPPTPATAEEKIPTSAKPGRPTAFEPDPAQSYQEVVMIPPPTLIDQASPQAPTQRSLPLPPPPPLLKTASTAPVAKSAGVTTDQLQNQAAAKPFFTQLLSSDANQQHKRLVIAVPLLLLAIILVFVFAYIASK